MSLNVGTIYAQLSANVSAFVKGMDAAADSVREVTKNLEGVRNATAIA